MGKGSLGGQSGAGFPAGWKEDRSAVVATANIAKYDPVTVIDKSNFDTIATDVSANLSITATDIIDSISTNKNGLIAIALRVSPYLLLYKNVNGVFTKLANPATLPASLVESVDFSADGNYLAIGYRSTPFIIAYKIVGEVFTKLANPATLPASYGNSVKFTQDGKFLAVGCNAAPYIMLYSFANDVLSYCTAPGTMPTAAVRSIDFGVDNKTLAVGVGSSATTSLMLYEIVNGILVITSNKIFESAIAASTVRFSPDGLFLAVNIQVSPYLLIYKIKIGGRKLAITGIPTYGYTGIDFSPDGKFIALTGQSPPYAIVYKINGEEITQLTNITNLPTGICKGVNFAKDGRYLYLGWMNQNSPYTSNVKIYNATVTTNAEKLTIFPSGHNVDVGIAKEAGVVGATIKVNLFPVLNNL